jgi:hypothetical protein
MCSGLAVQPCPRAESYRGQVGVEQEPGHGLVKQSRQLDRESRLNSHFCRHMKPGSGMGLGTGRGRVVLVDVLRHAVTRHPYRPQRFPPSHGDPIYTGRQWRR